MTYKKILIAVDGSEYSMKAAKKGLELAHQLMAEAALLFVVDLAKTMRSVENVGASEEALIVLKKEAEQTLAKLEKLNEGKELLKFMPEGHPNEDIIKTAEVWEADIIVMGTHSRTGLPHLLIGSIAENIVRHSKIPVLVVPSK